MEIRLRAETIARRLPQIAQVDGGIKIAEFAARNLNQIGGKPLDALTAKHSLGHAILEAPDHEACVSLYDTNCRAYQDSKMRFMTAASSRRACRGGRASSAGRTHRPLPGTASTPGPISSSVGLRGALRLALRADAARPRGRARCPSRRARACGPCSAAARRRRVDALRADPPPAGEGRKFRRRVVHHRQFGRAQALDLVAQARRFLEVEVGGGGAHARFQIGDHGLEIVADGGGVLELAAGAGAGRDQHVVALVDAVAGCRRCPCARFPA